MEQSFIKQYQLEDLAICDKLINLIHVADSRSLTSKGVTGYKSSVKPNIKVSTDLWLGDAIPKLVTPEDINWFVYHKELSSFIDNYCTDAKLYMYAGKFEMLQPPQIQWYKPKEGFFEWHIDGGHEFCNRAMAFITYLNDVPDGGTEFLHQEITVPAKKGNTVIFPAGITHIHRGQISQTHDKYILTGWLWWDNTK